MLHTLRKANGFVGASAITAKRFIKFDLATQLLLLASADAYGSFHWGVSEVDGEANQDSPISFYRSGNPVKVTSGEAIPWGAFVKAGADGKAYVAHEGELALGVYDHPFFSGDDGKTPMDVRSGADVTITLFEVPYRVGQGGIVTVVGEYDFAEDGGAVGDIKLRRVGGEAGDAHSDVQIPANARILYSGYEVLTTFASPTGPDNATVGLFVGASAAPEATIRAAVAISDGANAWDAGAFDGAHDWTAANSEKTAANGDLLAAVGVEAVTAGKLRAWVAYVVTGTA